MPLCPVLVNSIHRRCCASSFAFVLQRPPVARRLTQTEQSERAVAQALAKVDECHAKQREV